MFNNYAVKQSMAFRYGNTLLYIIYKNGVLDMNILVTLDFNYIKPLKVMLKSNNQETIYHLFNSLKCK